MPPTPKRSAKLPLIWLLLAAAVALCVLAYQWTGRVGAISALPQTSAARVAEHIDAALDRDQGLDSAAAANAALADSRAEAACADQAERAANALLDLSFSIALEQAEEQAKAAAAKPAASTPDSAEAEARLRRATASVAADQAALPGLEAKAAADPAAKAALALAQAQLGFDQAQLTDATADAARTDNGGTRRLGELQAEHNTLHAAVPATVNPAQNSSRDWAAAPGLVGKFRAVSGIAGKIVTLRRAEAAALAAQAQIASTHDRMEESLQTAEKAPVRDAATYATLTARQRQISRFDQQNDAATELADAYAAWLPLAAVQSRDAWHAALRALLWLLGIVAVLLAIFGLAERALARRVWERKRAAIAHNALRLGVQSLALICGLIVAFGQPTQLLTFIGLCGAGLTVVFQDAILSMAGWFVLVGRNGVHVADWVEINGVSGEVAEVTLFKTVLLETGNWIGAGLPTGRRVFFPNSFAWKGSYFNFTTAGQWMWDELEAPVPAGLEPEAAVERVESAVAAALDGQAASAEADWEKLREHAGGDLRPRVQLRPAGSGLQVVVRYMVPASERAALRERIFSALRGAFSPAKAAAS